MQCLDFAVGDAQILDLKNRFVFVQMRVFAHVLLHAAEIGFEHLGVALNFFRPAFGLSLIHI